MDYGSFTVSIQSFIIFISSSFVKRHAVNHRCLPVHIVFTRALTHVGARVFTENAKEYIRSRILAHKQGLGVYRDFFFYDSFPGSVMLSVEWRLHFI